MKVTNPLKIDHEPSRLGSHFSKSMSGHQHFFSFSVSTWACRPFCFLQRYGGFTNTVSFAYQIKVMHWQLDALQRWIAESVGMCLGSQWWQCINTTLYIVTPALLSVLLFCFCQILQWCWSTRSYTNKSADNDRFPVLYSLSDRTRGVHFLK